MSCSSFMAKGVKSFLLIGGLLSSLPAFATSYGIFDPRSLAMGGATVAAGSTDHAHFYNPALLSFENEDEDKSENGRFIFPGAVVLFSDAGEAVADIVADDLDERITDSINQFNTTPTDPEAAQSVLDSLNDFDGAIDALNRENIEYEAFVGLSVSEPADREGGSFYFGVRGVVFGRANVTDADLATMDSYIAAMETIVAGGTLADIDPSLVNNGQLVDPRPTLTSDAQISSLAIGEWGIAMSKEFSVLGQPVAFGATPKIMQVEVYRENVDFVNDIPSYTENRKTHLTMNLDFGVAAEVFDNFRVGLAVRDILPKTFESENNLQVKLRPRSRMGLAYVNEYLTVGLDYDIQKNKPVATEPESQEAALGLEISPWKSVDLRFGYRQDMIGERDDILSAGVRYQIWRFVAEAALATSDDVTGGAIQVGWAF